ncbi:MAG: beta family protein [Candidatus Paceibacterota bacterium]|jgi:hypothetical protein
MLNSNHYTPILKWKRAEQGALKELADKDKVLITPFIQFVMPKPKLDETLEGMTERFEKQSMDIPEKIVDIWGKSLIMIDFSLLYIPTISKTKIIEKVLSSGEALGAKFIPAIHLSDEEEIKSKVCLLSKDYKNGICLRLVCSDLSDIEKLNLKIKDFLSTYKISEDSIDLLVDIKEIGEDTDKYNKYFNLSQEINNLKKWRSFIFSSGSFPVDLSECKLDEENLIPRTDWVSWVKQTNTKGVIRKPTFSDYTIQHPIYKESTQFFHPTSSLKYTLSDNWLIMKGKKQKFEDYLAHAKTLVSDPRFSGKEFSFGDNFISEKADHFDKYISEKNKGVDIKGTGSTETWLKAAINHHLVLVANQVSNLS